MDTSLTSDSMRRKHCAASTLLDPPMSQFRRHRRVWICTGAHYSCTGEDAACYSQLALQGRAEPGRGKGGAAWQTLLDGRRGTPVGRACPHACTSPPSKPCSMCMPQQCVAIQYHKGWPPAHCTQLSVHTQPTSPQEQASKQSQDSQEHPICLPITPVHALTIFAGQPQHSDHQPAHHIMITSLLTTSLLTTS